MASVAGTTRARSATVVLALWAGLVAGSMALASLAGSPGAAA
jgi:hypothetical protein